MTAGRASPGRQAPVSSLRSGEDWVAWLRQACPAPPPGRAGGGGPGLAMAWEALVYLARRQGFAVHRGDSAAPEGFTTWPDRRIRVPGDAAPRQAVAALAHQIGHVLLHGGIVRPDPGGSVPCQGARKVEADSVAYLVCVHLGVDGPDITFPTVSSWAGADPRAQPARITQAVSDRVLASAALINRHLDTELGIEPEARAPALTAAARASRPASPPEAIRDLVQVNQAGAQFFRGRLAGSWAPGYLAARGFGPAVQQRWEAGYAPARWDALTCYLRDAGYPDPLIEASGLAHHSRQGTLIDTFRDRVMLPIHAPDGTIVAFIGRAHERAGAGVPKYLNSPHSALYDKSSVLFGLWHSCGALARGARPVLVEGPFDAIAVTTAAPGRYAGIAPCGTALTARHLAALDGATDLRAIGVLVAFDADQAGRRAAVRAYDMLTPLTGNMVAVSFPAGQDAAQILQTGGPAALASLLGRPQPLADLVIDAEVARWDRWLQYAEGTIHALRATAPLIAAMPPADVGRQVARVAERLGLDHSAVTRAVTDALPSVVTAGKIASARDSAARWSHPEGGNPAAVRAASRDFPHTARQAIGQGATDRSQRGGASRAAEPQLRGGRVAG